MKKTVVALVLLIMLLIPAMVFAGGDKEDSSSTGAKAEKQEEINLSLFRWSLPDNRKVVYDKYIAQFEKDNPGVTVELSAVPWGEFVDSLTRFQMAGTLPDVFAIYDASIGTFHATGSLLAIDQYVPADFRANFYETHWDHTVIDGKTYGVVFRNGTHMLFYNKDMFREAGLPQTMIDKGPQTFDDVRKAAVACTKAGQYGYADGYGDEEGYHQWRSYVMSSGDNPIDMKTYEARMNKPAGVESLQLLVDLNTTLGAVPPGSLAKTSALRNQEFVNGLAAMVEGGIWIEQQWKDAGSQFDLGVTTLPHSSKLADKYMGASAAFVAHAVATNTPHPELSAKLAMHMASYGFVNEYCQVAGLLPPRRDVAEKDPYWKSGRIPQYIAATTAPNFGALPKHPKITDFSKIIQTAIEEAMMGTKTVQKALDDASAKWNAIK